MKKPTLSASTLLPKTNEELKPSKRKNVLRPKTISKRENKYFVKTKKIKFLADLQMNILFREKPTPTAFFNGIKEQNENHHSANFDDVIKQNIDELCDQAIQDFGHYKMAELVKIMNLLKLGGQIQLSNMQELFPIVQYGKAHLENDAKRSEKKVSEADCWQYLSRLKATGVPSHKYNKELQKKFGLTEGAFREIVSKFKKS